jgi:prephenate dehydratase
MNKTADYTYSFTVLLPAYFSSHASFSRVLFFSLSFYICYIINSCSYSLVRHNNHNVSHHQAALSAFPQQDTPGVTLTPLVTIEDVFSAVQTGTAYRGVVPFENSSNGSVVFTLDLFADIQSKYPDILVCGEAYVAVRHCLLGYTVPATENSSTTTIVSLDEKQGEGRESSTPGTTDLSHIKRVYSHPQAWGQCKTFLNKYLKTAEKHDVSSTSKAAEIAAQDKTGESAALSSIVAAQLFGLQVLAEGVNDHLGNTTRFLVLRRRQQQSEEHGRSTTGNHNKTPSTTTTENQPSNTTNSSSWKSLVTFTVEHSNPGALANCLTAFSRHGINLTSINTRPSGVQNWHYIFFVELKGRREEGDDDDNSDNGGGAVNMALRELDKVCSGYRWLGSWENKLDETKDV